MADVQVTQDDLRSRFVATVHDKPAGFVTFRRPDDATVELVHTEIDDAYEGRGVGGSVVREVLDQLRAAKLRVVPTCPFVADWIDRHPEYQDLVATG